MLDNAQSSKSTKEDDHTQEQQHMDKVNVNDQIWLGAMAWLGRAEVGMKFALINTRFDTMVDVQLRRRQWRLGEFHICKKEKKGTGAEIVTSDDGSSFITLPFAKTPLPDSIVGFRTFSIWYIDEEVVAFLENIRRLFSSDISLEFSIRMTEYRSWQAMARHIWPLLKDGIWTLVNLKKCQLALLRKHVSPTVLYNCVNLYKIYTPIMPECPSGEASDNTAGRELYAWMHSPRLDHRLIAVKLLKSKEGFQQFLDDLFKSFEEATSPVKYLVYGLFPFGFAQYGRIENTLRDERISMQVEALNTQDGRTLTSVIVLRSEVNFGEQKLVSWLLDAKVSTPPNLIHIGFSDDEIGPLPLPIASVSRCNSA